MSTYLTWLANEFRAAGLVVVEYDGWTTRARSSGGFASGKPWGVWWHHTASATSPQNDSNYMCHQSDNRPVANVLIARDGAVWVLAAGATNTNGKGQAMAMSRGVVPQDSANTHVFGMEIANNGVGEPYLVGQINAAFIVSNVVNRHMGNQPTDVCTHQHYAPDRKIDPAMGGNCVQGSWHPREVTNSGTWSVDDLRAECQRRSGSVPPPQPPGDDDDMVEYIIGYAGADTDGALYSTNCHTKTWLTDSGMVSGKETVITLNGGDAGWRSIPDRDLFKAYGPVVGPRPAGADEWGLP